MRQFLLPKIALPIFLCLVSLVITSYSIHYTKLYDDFGLDETIVLVAGQANGDIGTDPKGIARIPTGIRGTRGQVAHFGTAAQQAAKL